MPSASMQGQRGRLMAGSPAPSTQRRLHDVNCSMLRTVTIQENSLRGVPWETELLCRG